MTSILALLAMKLRRDSVQLIVWIGATAALTYLTVVGVAQSYGTAADRTSLLAAALANPVILLFRGLPSGTGAAAFTVFLILPWLVLMAALMSTFLAVRQTRTEEESGRAEQISATPAARLTAVWATLLEGFLALLLLGAVVAVIGMLVGMPIFGSLLMGAATSASGGVFFGVGAVAGQLMGTSRAANALAVWITIGMLVIAGFGNAIGTPNHDLTRMESSWPTWVSPFGWAENTRAFDQDAWWPVALCIGVAALLCAASLALASVRDVGASIVAQRQGRSAASFALSTPTGLAWRLNRGAIVGWTAGGLLTGILATALATVVQRVSAQNPAVKEILSAMAGRGGDLEQATVTVFFTMLGIFAACCAVQVICRARQEETHGTAAAVLATPTGRVPWLVSYLLVAGSGIILVCAAAVVGAAIGLGGRSDHGHLLGAVVVAGAGQALAALVFLAVTALIFVAAPPATIAAGWSLVVLGAAVGLFGPLFGLAPWLSRLSPIASAPRLDGAHFRAGGLWWMVVVVAAAVIAATALMRRRESAGH